MEDNKIIVELSENGERLDKILIGKVEGSRSEIQKKIKAGDITVNGKKVTPHHFVRTGDIVRISAAKIKIAKKEEKINEPEIEIIHEDPDYLIVYKPAGLLVHAVPGKREPTLSAALQLKYPEIQKVGEAGRYGIVHRLDREVSGLLIVARTPRAYEYFKNAFATREVKKEYLGLAYGEVPNEAGDIVFKVGRGRSGKMAARPEGSDEGKEALTKYEIIKQYQGYTFLKIRIITGRTHQIRVHFLALGYPLVGDAMYAKAAGKFKKIPLDRVFLHAASLSFTDLNGKPQEFHKDLPAELEEVLKNLK
jgi:23S rRNA pseudouridine1911/1915/1917 synthase